MTHAPKDDFTIEWRIVNFSMCPQKKGECIASPTFVVDVFDKTKWHLELYPKGDDTTVDGYFSLHVVRTDKTEVKICFTISRSTVPTPSPVPLGRAMLTVETIDNYGIVEMACLKCYSNESFVVREIEGLTLHCRMRRFPDVQQSQEKMRTLAFPSRTQIFLEELSSVISDDFVTAEYYPTSSSFCSTIPSERRRITWTIKDFKNQTRSSQRITISVLSAVREQSALILSCYASGDWNSEDGSVCIDIQRKDRHLKQMLVRCKVFVLDKSGFDHECKEGAHLFGKDYDVWTFPPIIKLSNLQGRKSDLLEDDQLSLRCEFIFAYEEVVTVVGGNLRTYESIEQEQSMGHDMNELLQDTDFADVKLISEDLELAVHKSVLCARSLVFRDKFRGDTEENRTGVVRITDIDAETVKNMRNFLYKGLLLELQQEDNFKLYSAADKYQILSLQTQCASCIKYNLSLSNVCDVLLLVDMDQNSDLEKYIENFLCVHAKDVFHSTEWEDLMKKNLQLATKTMQKTLAKIGQLA